MKEGFGSWRRKRLVSSTKGKEKKSSSQMWRWGRIVTFPHPFSESMGKEHRMAKSIRTHTTEKEKLLRIEQR